MPKSVDLEDLHHWDGYQLCDSCREEVSTEEAQTNEGICNKCLEIDQSISDLPKWRKEMNEEMESIYLQRIDELKEQNKRLKKELYDLAEYYNQDAFECVFCGKEFYSCKKECDKKACEIECYPVCSDCCE